MSTYSSCAPTLSSLDGGRVRCGTLPDASRVSSLDHSPARVPLATTTTPPTLALLSCLSLAGSMIPVLVPVAAPLPATPGGGGGGGVSTSKAIRFRVPSTMYGSQPVISPGSCHWANSSANNRDRCPPPAARCNSQLATRPLKCRRPLGVESCLASAHPLVFPRLPPFASNKKAHNVQKRTQGPNFSSPSITLSDVGPDPGLPSTRQDKPTMHLVFCGCRVPDPRPPSPSPSPSSAPSPSPSLLSLPSHARRTG
ncbi:hypothetical protein CDEST_01333 [Colletotrichum destructivum]|uniref:Uncharacterized protein n=1 Tax=Colletotrichum destructivum TaxID=34406 RepID=A0AAX4HZE6_9PEZI|nr:hypothetical protein CDEST_01333 [Colletotrichum destructivum]